MRVLSRNERSSLQIEQFTVAAGSPRLQVASAKRHLQARFRGAAEHFASDRGNAVGLFARFLGGGAEDVLINVLNPDALVRGGVFYRHGDERERTPLVLLDVDPAPEEIGKVGLGTGMALLGQDRQVVHAALGIVGAPSTVKIDLGQLELGVLVAEEGGGVVQIVDRALRVG